MKVTEGSNFFYDRIKRLAGIRNDGGNNNNNGITSKDEIEKERQLQIKFGQASLRYEDPNKSYETVEDKRLRSEYLVWYQELADQVRQKVLDSGNQNFIENIDEAVKRVMDSYVQDCKDLFIEECKYSQTIVSENKIREENARTGNTKYYDIQWHEISHEQYSAL